MDKVFLDKLKNSTPVIQNLETFMDADDEMLEIAEYIKKHNQHNEYIEPKRIKFLYSPKPKKDGGRFIINDLIKRSDMEKMVNDQYDFILTMYYDVWNQLAPQEKIIQLDKALCGIESDITNENVEPKPKKKSPDSKEYISNMKFYGPDVVMKISETIDLACTRIMEEKKEKAKQRKAGEVEVAE